MLHDSPAVLSLPILQPCLRSKQLLILVDPHTGIFLAQGKVEDKETGQGKVEDKETGQG